MGVFQDGLNIYPKNYEINLNFTVVHEQKLGWDYSERKKLDEGTTVKKSLAKLFPYGTDISTERVQLPNPINEENKDQYDEYQQSLINKLIGEE